MQCMVCATELLHAANFCPVCGARLAAPSTDGSVATSPGGEQQPPVMIERAGADSEPNIVYLPNSDAADTPPDNSGEVGVNPQAAQYTATTQPVSDPSSVSNPPHIQPDPSLVQLYSEPQTPASYAEEIVQSMGQQVAPVQAQQIVQSIQEDLGQGPLNQIPQTIATSGSHGPTPTPAQLVPPQAIDTNPFGDFFSDGPTAWIASDVDEGSVSDIEIIDPRIAGTVMAVAAIGLMVAAWVTWGFGVVNGAGGAEASPLIFVSIVLWIWYLCLPREQQHRALLVKDHAIAKLVERRATPLRKKTEGSMTMRKERDRYRAMRDERERRIIALGEAAQRSFRSGHLPHDLHGAAQRVVAIERQMLAQDTRIHNLVEERVQNERDRRWK